MSRIKYQYKYETHCHTSEASACAKSTAAEIVAAYYEAGYSGIVMTDHFLNGNTSVDTTLPWEAQIKDFCSGYHKALKAAEGLEFQVLLGLEWRTDYGEFLTYGLDEAFMLKTPEMMDWTLEMYFDKVHEAGGFISHAHPFRGKKPNEKVYLNPEEVDAVEVVNGSNPEAVFNKKALDYADLHGLIHTRGSDTHNSVMLEGEGLYFEKRVNTIEGFIQMLKEGRYE